MRQHSIVQRAVCSLGAATLLVLAPSGTAADDAAGRQGSRDRSDRAKAASVVTRSPSAVTCVLPASGARVDSADAPAASIVSTEGERRREAPVTEPACPESFDWGRFNVPRITAC